MTMMSQIELLQVGPYPSWDQERLDAHFTMHRYFEAADKAAFLAQVGPSVRAIATRGELGANRAMIEACPKLEIVAVYGVGYDAVDLEACRERGIRVTNTPDVLRIIFGSAFLRPAGVRGYHQNTAGFDDPRFDALVEQALATQDGERRRELYHQAQALASSQYLQLTTYPQSTRLGIYKRAHGVRLEPSLAVTSLYDAWVNP